MDGLRDDVTAFVLAGGKSSRMGADKAFVKFDGQTLLERALDVAHALTPKVFIVGSQEKFAGFAPVVEDIFPEHGPLGGIHAALRSSATDLNLMLAVDMPFVSPALLQCLITEAKTAGDASVVAPRPDGRWEPLCAVYRKRFADIAEKALLAGSNKVDALFMETETRPIEEDKLARAGFSTSMFRNLNTVEELNQASRAIEITSA
jgi:molybdopterin-guanine dinucleotide biosynthesis protein A